MKFFIIAVHTTLQGSFISNDTSITETSGAYIIVLPCAPDRLYSDVAECAVVIQATKFNSFRGHDILFK